ncbi:hypothetical protein ACR6C2_04105 [Streptomyces sp. INA 01156]
MLLRPAHLGRANAFALLRLLPMSDRDTDVELLTLRHRLPGRTDDVLGKDDVAGRGGRRGSTSRLRQGGGQGAGRCQDGARAAESAV